MTEEQAELPKAQQLMNGGASLQQKRQEKSTEHNKAVLNLGGPWCVTREQGSGTGPFSGRVCG